MPRSRRSPVPLAVLFAAALVPRAAGAQDAGKYYEDNCAVCHTIGGGDQVGPDLKGSAERLDRKWLVRFLLDPEGVVKSGDEYAVRQVAKWNDVVMPTSDGITREMAEALIDFIAVQSRGGTAAPAPAEPIVFTDADRALGLDLFTGRVRLANAGPACVSCHALGDMGGTRGGALGPDLAAVHTRLGGARGTTSWLSRPPTPLMRAVYRKASLTEDESRSLAALFESAASANVVPQSASWRRLALTGLGGALGGLVVIGIAWRGRFRNVRRRLLDHRRGRNQR